MKKFNVTMIYSVWGMTSVEVPDDYTLEQAIQYANDNIRDIPIPKDAEYISKSESIDEENCDFDEERTS